MKTTLYCRCAWANVVPKETKDAVLAGLSDSGQSFDMVPDLCEMAARRDPKINELATSDTPLQIAACHHRAVKGLFKQCGVELPESTTVHNMRDESAEKIVDELTR